MANSRSALKRVRKTETQSSRNRAIKSRVKTFRKKLITSIEGGDATAAQAALQEFSSAADKAGRANVIHPNSAARQKSNLSRRVKALG